MTDLSRIDRAVLQLRTQLQRVSRERGRGAAPVSGQASPLQRLKDLAGAASDEQEFRRAFVRAVLTEELGENIANHPEFEAISNRVWTLIDEDGETRDLMDQAIRQLGD